MDNEERGHYDDSLFEETSVVTAGATAGTALLFRSEGGQKINDYFLKRSLQARYYIRYLSDNIDDLTQINKKGFNNATKQIDKTLEEVRTIGFKASDTEAVQGLFELYGTMLSPGNFLRNLYDSDLRGHAKNAIESIKGLSPEIKSALMSNIGTFAFSSATPSEIHSQLAKRLGELNFNLAVEPINAIVDSIEQWKTDNLFDEGDNSWMQKKGNTVLKEYQRRLGDWEQVYGRQQEEKKSIHSRLMSEINPDRHVTFGDILEIDKDYNNPNRDTIRNFLSRDRSFHLGTENIDLLFPAKTNETINKQLKGRLRMSEENNISITLLELLKAQESTLSDKQLEAFRKIEFTNLRFSQSGSIYTMSDAENVLDKVVGDIFDIFPFRMAKVNDIRAQRLTRKATNLFKNGDLDAVLADSLGTKDYLNSTVVEMYGKYYKVNDNGTLEHLKDLDGATTYSTKTGLMKNVVQSQNGGIAITPDDVKNAVERKINAEFEGAVRLTRENGNNAYIFGAFTQSSIDYLKALKEAAENGDTIDYYNLIESQNKADKFRKFLEKTTYGLDRKQALKLIDAVGVDENSSRFLDYIVRLEDPESVSDVISELAKLDTNNITYKNSGLSKSIRRYMQNPDTVKELYSSTLKDPLARNSGQYKSLSFVGELKKQLSQEFMSRYEETYGLTQLNNIISSIFKGMEKDQISGLAAVQKYLAAIKYVDTESLDEDVTKSLNIESVINGLEKLTNDSSEDATLLKNLISEHILRNSDKFRDEIKENAKDQIINVLPGKTVLRDSKIRNQVLEMLNNMNQGHFEKAADNALGLGKSIVNQLLGGAGDPQNNSLLSAIPYYFLNRANQEFKLEIRPWFSNTTYKMVDFSLKGDDIRTTKDLIKNFAKKRIGAAAAVGLGLAFADDMLKATTGMGGLEAGASGLANSYLGIKRITGATGFLDDSLKGLSQDNAIFGYFGEFTGESSGEWNTYDEQLDYYRNGSTPIRKARFWTFGSSNEARGGRISYFEPNTLRSLASDYKDMSLYNGSYWNKWNPLNILDPYYLEDLHSEDRPYPVSGSLFAENTPWGVVLNPTIGAMLKPKRFLHTDRLSRDGVDAKALIYQMNSQIRDKAVNNNNLFYVQNGKMRSMDFMAYNAPTYSERSIILDTDDQEIKYNDYGLYNTPAPIENGAYQELVLNNQDFINNNKKLTFKDEVAIEAAKGNKIAQIANIISKPSALNIIKQENQQILAKAGYDKSQGIMIENKLSTSVDPVDQLLEDSEHIAELMNSGSTNDYIHEMAVSARMITGLYGWGISNALDIGQNNQDRIATSSDMTSFSRDFWDSGIGGAGGGLMEITRRFIPEYRRFQTYNPLMNTMPDWLPDRLRIGDPYTKIPVGEARLPGYGYESLNILHPDNFGRYGAFDRFKILADVAPYSPEYKFWKSIAGKTVTDPTLKAEMKQIRERVKLQSKQHNTQEYKYVGRDVDRRNAYVTEINQDGTFKIFGSDETYKLAGATISANEQENRNQVLSRYIQPGQLVSLMIDTNEAYARNKDKNRTINAAVLVDGENVSEMMIKNGDATKRQSDTSAAAYMANHGDTVNTINWLSEVFMHTDFPILHNRWFRVNSALEDYQDEYLYGTSFQDWSAFWDSYVIPNARKEAASSFWTGTAIVADVLRNNITGESKNNLLADVYNRYAISDGPLGKNSKFVKSFAAHESLRIIRQGSYFLDRGGLAGYMIGKIGSLGASDSATFANKTRRIGSAANLAFSAFYAPENLTVGMMSWSRLGYLASNEFFGGKAKLMVSAAGAAIGVARWAFDKHLLSSDEYNDVYIPESAKKKWELQDYFDRLTYIKYMALYEKAADKALSEENVDIKAILTKQDEEAKNIKESKKEIKETLTELDNVNTAEAAQEKKLLAQKLSLATPSKIPLSGGDYTKSAIMYYNAAKSTMYALDETSSMSDIIRALPKTDREYFIEFLKEKDEEKRQEILKYSSPQIKKALNMLWYQKFEDPESNEEFFQKHAMPAPTWSGWNPNIDLADVQTKVIKNEGMNYSDFGVYASQYREPEVINAPSLDYSSRDSLIEAEMKITTLLSGIGLMGVEVNVEPSKGSTLEVIANIGRVVDYKLGNVISDIFEGI